MRVPLCISALILNWILVTQHELLHLRDLRTIHITIHAIDDTKFVQSNHIHENCKYDMGKYGMHKSINVQLVQRNRRNRRSVKNPIVPEQSEAIVSEDCI